MKPQLAPGTSQTFLFHRTPGNNINSITHYQHHRRRCRRNHHRHHHTIYWISKNGMIFESNVTNAMKKWERKHFFLTNHCKSCLLSVVIGKLSILVCSFFLQVRQEIAQEYEQIKDITQTLANFKKDTVHFGGPRRVQEEEPTRDPDVWPPPTPAERDSRSGFLCKSSCTTCTHVLCVDCTSLNTYIVQITVY